MKGKGIIADSTRPPNRIHASPALAAWILTAMRSAKQQLRKCTPRGEPHGRSRCIAGLSLLAPQAGAENTNRRVLVRDITSVEGVRDNMLVGYGLVVGLNRTGDTQQTYFTVQTLANAMQKMGVLISAGQVK